MIAARHREVVRALAKRDLWLYFTNPSGYVFVTLFIFLSAAAAFWQQRFFFNNLANLDQLNNYFSYLILFFVPALTMGVWASEQRQGTEELLLTLPASDLDIVLGKFLATVGIYSVSLLLALSNAIVLFWLGSPDPGVLAANYLGYWLVGVSLISVGMVASLITSNITVAFILGSLFCSVPLFLPAVAGLFGAIANGLIAPFGVDLHFLDFARGLISLSGLAYFASLTVFFLYLNVLLLGRRHWPRLTTGTPISVHVIERACAVFVALVGFNVLLSRLPVRVDVSAEHLHSLSNETLALLSGIPPDRTVFIQAFVSPEVPQTFVPTRENLLNVLREISARAKGKVQVLITNTVPYSNEARSARERFGILPAAVSDPENPDPQSATDGIFLAVAVNAGAEEQVIPFMDRGLSPEYEIARAVRIVARTGRKRVGIVATDANLLGGVDPNTGEDRPPWAIVGELAKQYDIVQISPSRPLMPNVDALLIAQPSTLLQFEMDNLKNAVLMGIPALIIVDPVTSTDMRLSPAAPLAARVDPYATQNPTLQKNFGDVQKMMTEIGVKWPPTSIVWDSYNPHPDMSELPPEVIFVGKGSGSSQAFNPGNAATEGLQEVMMLYSGYLAPSDPTQFRFTPLLRTGTPSGTDNYFDLVQPGPNGAVLNTGLLHEPDSAKQEYVLAAQVQSLPGVRKENAIVIADLDFIADQFFEIRAQGASNAAFDNITFFLNCLDELAGDTSFIGLRKRRIRLRTLDRVEAETRSFAEQRTKDEQQADRDAQRALAEAQAREKNRIDDIQGRADLDPQAKQVMARNVDEVEKRKLDVLSANIQLAEQAKVQGIRENMESQVRHIQDTIRTTAVVAPPIPVLLFGVMIFVRRRRRERDAGVAVGRVKDAG